MVASYGSLEICIFFCISIEWIKKGSVNNLYFLITLLRINRAIFLLNLEKK